jgi:hypothetical protein
MLGSLEGQALEIALTTANAAAQVPSYPLYAKMSYVDSENKAWYGYDQVR